MTRSVMSQSSLHIRAAFLDYFRHHGHSVQNSAPIVPQNDPTLMFTNAGMVPFKDVFTGKDTRPFTRATSSQKCIRISGKHNDLENVGVTARHHTFFEMLGNFSFGDYFKEEAIQLAWELLTRGFGIPPERLVITVFAGDSSDRALGPDDEARAIWKRVTGFGDERILGLGMKDNFWQMGEVGPCGPCSEIHYFHGDDVDLGKFGEEPTASGFGWTEIWNLVFMQYDRRDEGGKYVLGKLPKPSVDTGMGLERITSVLQGTTSNYDTDLLRPLVDKAAAISKKSYHGTQADDDTSMRVIADHARTAAFLIAEGVFPDRAGREYVLRRVMRRAVRHGHRLGITRPFLHEVALEVVAHMGEAYPELVARKDLIATVTEQEEVRFRETIDRGLKILDDEIAALPPASGAAGQSPSLVGSVDPNLKKRLIPGAAVFKLYDTFGFPPDLTQVIAEERGLSVDMDGYDKALAEQRARSEHSKVGDEAVLAVWQEAMDAARAAGIDAVRFTGYEREQGKGKVIALVKGAFLVDRAEAGELVGVITDTSPFYGEAGGQVGDQGVLRGAAVTLDVLDTQRPVTGLVVHLTKVREGSVAKGETLDLEVDHERRSATRRNHSATHILHWALRKVLGEQATQKGSLVGPDRLRFDFSHGKAVTPEQLVAIEDLVNSKILTNAKVETEVLPIDVARAKGAMAIFEEKYGEVVRVLTMTPDSVELCGGTHARFLGDIGLFKIVSEGGIAAGVRRIEAATGLNALAYVRELEGTVRSVSRIARSGTHDLPEKLEKLIEKERSLEKEIVDLKRKLAVGGGSAGGRGVDEWAESAREIPLGKALAVRVDGSDPGLLRELADKLRDKLGDSVVLVGGIHAGKVQLVVTVSKSLVGRYRAGDVVKQVAEVVGGSGGGRPDMAQAGGAEVAKIDEALARFYVVLT
jgi:alanyl-tRNA synthetase